MSAFASARLVHVMGWRSQQYGSFERFLVALSGAWADAGGQMHLVFQGTPASERFRHDVAAKIHVVPPARAPGDALHCARIGRVLRRVGATHLHAHFGTDAYHALAMARLLGVPRRYTTKHITPATAPWMLPGVRHRWLARQVEVDFAVSEWIGERLRACGVPDEKIEVCYLGVDPDAYRPDAELRAATRAALGVPATSRLLLATSHLRPGKGVELLPQLATALPEDVVVMVAGDGPLRPALEAQRRERGLGDGRLRLLGVREDVPALLAAADLFVFPTTATEGMPLGVLEALAAGVPVVASDVSDNGTLTEGAALVAPGDLAALVQACRSLLDAPQRAAALGERGRRLATERFSVAHAVDRHLARYRA